MPDTLPLDERRVQELSLELTQVQDATYLGTLHHELGTELLKRDAQASNAAKHFLKAYQLRPDFLAPLRSLTRLFEQRESYATLRKLYETIAAKGTTPTDRADALVELATLLAGPMRKPRAALGKLRRAIELDPQHWAAGHFLDFYARRVTDTALLVEGSSHRTRVAGSDWTKARFSLEHALALEASGWEQATERHDNEQNELDGRIVNSMLEACDQAIRLDPTFTGAIRHKLRIATGAGRSHQMIEALEQWAQATDDKMEKAIRLARAAEYRILLHFDTAGAVRCYDEAVQNHTGHVYLHRQRMLAAGLAEDRQTERDEAAWLLQRATDPTERALYHTVLSLTEEAAGDDTLAHEHARTAHELVPQSVYGQLRLEALDLKLGQPRAVIQRVHQRANGSVSRKWRAAQLAVDTVKDMSLGHELYQDLAQDETVGVMAKWEALGSTLRTKESILAQEYATHLLQCTEHEDERDLLRRIQYEAITRRGAAPETLLKFLRGALADHGQSRWLAHATRVHAARHSEYALLAQCHHHLAEGMDAPLQQAAHLCAQCRALLRDHKESEALELLRALIEQYPEHGLGLTLTIELLRNLGREEELAELFQRRAASEKDEGAFRATIHAALVAEENGNVDTAISVLTRTLLETGLDTGRVSHADGPIITPDRSEVVWQLMRIGLRYNRPDARLTALTHQAHHAKAHTPERDQSSLQLAEFLHHHDKDYKQAELHYGNTVRPDSPVAARAALGMILLPYRFSSPENVLKAWKTLDTMDTHLLVQHALNHARHRAGEPRPSESPSTSEPELSQELGVLGISTEKMPASAHQQANAWARLARHARDARWAQELLLHASRVSAMGGTEDDTTDGFLLAHELKNLAPGEFITSVAVDEATHITDDATLRNEALQGAIDFAEPGTDTVSLRLARARALHGSADPERAINLLQAILEDNPDCLSAWELIRLVGRTLQRWPQVATACKRLAEHAPSPFREDLLEEAAITYADEMNEPEVAEELFSQVLQYDITRSVSFWRVHDRMSERGGRTALLGLVHRRTQVVHEPEELARLLYEKGRLERADGKPEAALYTLQELLLLEPNHVGAIALKAEIHKSSDQWAEAVRSLQKLATCDLPVSQQRLARLGASFFLSEHLNSPRAALTELEKAVELGANDRTTLAKVAELHVRLGHHEKAVHHFTEASKASAGMEAASLLHEAAEITRRDLKSHVQAIAIYRTALATAPGHTASIQRLVELAPDDCAHESSRYLAVLRDSTHRNPTDTQAMRKMAAHAKLTDQGALEQHALDAISCFETLTNEEHERLQQLEAGRAASQRGFVVEPRQVRLWDEPEHMLDHAARLLQADFHDLDQLTLETYGVTADQTEANGEPVAQQLASICSGFGLASAGIHRTPTRPSLVTLVPDRDGRIHWILGNEVEHRLTERQLFIACQMTWAMAKSALPLVHRTTSDAARLLIAAALVSGTPMDTPRSQAIKSLEQILERRLSKKTKQNARILFEGLTVVDIERWVERLNVSCLWVAALSCGRLHLCLEAVLQSRVSKTRVVESAQAKQTMEFWLGESAARHQDSVRFHDLG